jgi:hypothetical protein
MDKTTAMTGTTAVPRPGAAISGAALAAEAGRLKAKVDRLWPWPPAQPPTARHLGKPK